MGLNAPTTPKTKTMKSFAVILAAAVAAAQGQVVLPAGYAHAGLPAGYAHAGLPLGYHGLAPGFAAAPAAPKTYAVPPARIINEPAHVETIAEKVEQHGY